MKIVRDGYPFVIVTLIIAVLVTYFYGPVWGGVPLAAALYFAYFFRNPERPFPNDENVLYSPADGHVMNVEEIYDDEFLNAKVKKVTIFLSVFDVHVNRSPMTGEIKYQQYNVGKFVPAFEKQATFKNERHAIGLDNGKFKIVVIQIAGLLARRIVSWVTLGNKLQQGECYGMIKFGSSTELIMPMNFKILVHKGQRVVGGITKIAEILGEEENEL